MIDLSSQVSQQQFGELVGISQPAVSDLMARGVVKAGDSAGVWLLAYCKHMREMAAGRAAEGGLDLATERARLAREQADKVAMQNAVTRREYAPVSIIAEVLARAGRQIAVILEAVPVQLKRRYDLPVEQIEFITAEIVRARNVAAGIQIETADLGGDEEDEASAEPFEEES